MLQCWSVSIEKHVGDVNVDSTSEVNMTIEQLIEFWLKMAETALELEETESFRLAIRELRHLTMLATMSRLLGE